MNRDELLATVGVTEYRPGDKVIEATEGAAVLAHADIYYRRIVVSPPTPQGGNGVTIAGETLYVAALANFCFEPGQDWELELLRAARDEVERHPLIRWACVFADPESFERHGCFYHPEGHPDPRFLVLDLQKEPWPDGTVETTGQW